MTIALNEGQADRKGSTGQMPVELEPIKPRRLYREVADRLMQLIADDEFKPGERLPSERELAASLQVSRPTIREAPMRSA